MSPGPDPVGRPPGGVGRGNRFRNLHQDHGRRFGHRLQRPCRSRHRHPDRARTDRRRRTRRVLCPRRRGARRHLARSQSGRDHCQRNHPDHGGAACARPRRRRGTSCSRAPRSGSNCRAEDLAIEDGLIRGKDNRSVSYGELIAGETIRLELADDVAVKAVGRLHASSGNRCRASIFRPRRPASWSMSTTCACPACCTAAWCGRPMPASMPAPLSAPA